MDSDEKRRRSIGISRVGSESIDYGNEHFNDFTHYSNTLHHREFLKKLPHITPTFPQPKKRNCHPCIPTQPRAPNCHTPFHYPPQPPTRKPHSALPTHRAPTPGKPQSHTPRLPTPPADPKLPPPRPYPHTATTEKCQLHALPPPATTRNGPHSSIPNPKTRPENATSTHFPHTATTRNANPALPTHSHPEMPTPRLPPKTARPKNDTPTDCPQHRPKNATPHSTHCHTHSPEPETSTLKALPLKQPRPQSGPNSPHCP
ncbi:hypothetical protein HNY73_017985 [Argiope bruennichi]|uniref:Uncharacterized protein n=1 Tax=Argiope bruennichi TaxID=94029 RepID=A0A8T0ECJ7_ARGBR|nr:hypothetical protein HNY73_017985 [Argiope bruennichi]